jgi:hypothetical protein
MGRVWAPTAPTTPTGLAPSLAYPNLTVQAGAAWVDGHFCELPGAQVLTVTANGLCVVRFDPAANTAQLLYLDGVSVPSQSPTGTYEMPIAKISGSALTDVRPVIGNAGGFVATFNDAIDHLSIGATETFVLQTTIQTIPGRRYDMTLRIHTAQLLATDTFLIRGYLGGEVLAYATAQHTQDNVVQSIPGAVSLPQGGGTTNVKVSIQRIGGTSTVNNNAGGYSGTVLTVRDAGT